MELNVLFVSESELALADPEYTYLWLEQDKDRLYNLLFSLGLDTQRDLDFQEVTQHRNRLNKLVTCGRWAGLERIDVEWINSGYASRAAKLAASGCKMLGSELKKDIKEFRKSDNVSILTVDETKSETEADTVG